MTQEQAATIERIIKRFFPEAMAENYQHLIPSLTCQEKDRHVLAAAIMSESRIIVTANLKDYPSVALRPYQIQAQAPDECLSMLYNLDSSAMTRIIREQAADLHRVLATSGRILRSLEAHAPGFVRAVRTNIEDDEQAPTLPE